MATPAARNALHMPGELIKSPTSLSAAAPYGGTRLGLVRNMVFEFKAENYAIRAEEWGNQVVDLVYGGSSPVFGVTLREFDNDALSAMFLDTAVGSPSGDRSVHLRADTARAGTLASTKEVKLLFVPRAVLRQPSILIRAAVPALAEDTRLSLSMGTEVNIHVLWYARPDSSNRVATIAKLGDMTL